MLYIICNPTAGNGRAKKICQDTLAYLQNKNIEFEHVYTKRPGEATVLAQKAAERGFKTVLSVGGDGTAYEVACGLNGSTTALGIIPAGTGNDFIKTLGYPKDPVKALEFILAHSPKPTDTGLMNDRLFLNEIGTGFDALALNYASKMKKFCKGLLPYLLGVICALFRYTPLELTYQIDDLPAVTMKALVCGVANGRIIGGGIPIAPEASVEDGLFDVIIVRYIPHWRIFPYLPKLLAGKVLQFPETLFCRAKSVTFSSPDMIVNIDGELQNMDTVSLKISEGTLLVHR